MAIVLGPNQYGKAENRVVRRQTIYAYAKEIGLENPNEVFNAAERPYGLIQSTVLRDDAPPAGRAWDTIPGFV